MMEMGNLDSAAEMMSIGSGGAEGPRGIRLGCHVELESRTRLRIGGSGA